MNLNEFNNLINQDVVLVDFYATWCGPCKMMSPVLDELSNSRSIKVVKVDIDKSEELVKQYGIMSVPTLILFKNGQMIDKKSGYMPLPILSEWINEA